MEQDKPMIDPARLDQYLEHSMKAKLNQHYTYGWNAGLEMAAAKLVQEFSKSFGADTCASWAIWLKEQKK
jgi:hypothetical protein